MSNSTRDQEKVPNPAHRLQELIERLQNDKQPGRYSAARDIGEIGDDSAIEPLIKALSDRNLLVKEMAIQSLGKIGARSTQQVNRQQVINLLTEKIGANTALHKAVALGMATFGEDALPYLIPLLSEGSTASARCAATAISEIGMPALEILAEMLNHPNADIRKEAMSSLTRLLLSDSKVKSVMRSALKNPDAAVRADAAYQLGRLKDAAMIPELLIALRDGSAEVRAKATLALGNIGSSQAVILLIEAINDPSIVKQVVYALGEIGDDRAIPSLRAHFNNIDADLRFLLAMSLARCGDLMGIDELEIICSKSDDPEQVIYAVDALGEAGAKHPMLASHIIPILTARLDDNRSPRGDALNHLRAPRLVNRRSVLALEKIGTPEAIRAIRQQ